MSYGTLWIRRHFEQESGAPVWIYEHHETYGPDVIDVGDRRVNLSRLNQVRFDGAHGTAELWEVTGQRYSVCGATAVALMQELDERSA